MKEKTVTISIGEYNELCRRVVKLNALEAGGVNNWDWYDDAMENYHELLVEAGLEDE